MCFCIGKLSNSPVHRCFWRFRCERLCTVVRYYNSYWWVKMPLISIVRVLSRNEGGEEDGKREVRPR